MRTEPAKGAKCFEVRRVSVSPVHTTYRVRPVFSPLLPAPKQSLLLRLEASSMLGSHLGMSKDFLHSG